MLKANNKPFYFPLFSLFKGQNINSFFLSPFKWEMPFSLYPLPPFRRKCRKAKGVIYISVRQVSHDLMRINASYQALRCRHSNADLHFFSAPDGEDRRGEVIAKHSNADLQYGPKIHVITRRAKDCPTK